MEICIAKMTRKGTKSRNHVIRIATHNMSGQEYVDVRNWDIVLGQAVPTKKGIYISKEDLTEVINGLIEVREQFYGDIPLK